VTENRSASSKPVRRMGSLRVADGTGIVHIEDCLDTRIDDVWAALTDPERLARWLGTLDGDLRCGQQFHARFFASESEVTGRIEVCEPPQHLLVSMTETDTTDLQFMEVTLSARGEQTVLVVEERGMPPEQLAAYGAGVQVHVEDLATYLRGGERGDGQARWNELFPSYASTSIDPA
jgi:uncharacterized protein YndB with AHSA1/START domain